MIEQELVRYGYVFVFLGTILEGDATLVAASYLARRGYFEMGTVITLAVLATTGANHFYFVVARRNSSALLARVEGNPRLRQIRSWVLKRGGFLLVLSRFLFGLRVAIPAACGATGMRPLRFAAFNLAGAIIWGVLLGALGYAGGHVLSVLYRDLRRHEWQVAAALAALVALFALWRSRGRDLREARIAVKRPGRLADDSVRMVMEKKLPRWIGPESPLRGRSQRERMKNKDRSVDWFRRQPAWRHVTAGFAVIAAIGWLDFVVVKAMSLFTMYTAPVVWLAWFASSLAGYTGALLAGALLFIADRVSATHAGHVFIPYWNLGFQLILLLSFAWLIDHLKQALIREEDAKRHEIVRELEIAREVQARLLPRELPKGNDLSYGVAFLAAKEVAGDFYDILSPAPGSVGWVIGDVSGKGLPASLLMTSLVGALRAQTSAMRGNLCQTLGALNQFLFSVTESNRFATLFVGMYSKQDRVLEYINAGHNPPLIIRRGSDDSPVIRLDEGGPVLGVLPGARYNSVRLQLEPADLVVLYTDGVVEAVNERGEEFGEDRLVAVARSSLAFSPQDFCDKTVAEMRRFRGAEEQRDDVTLLAVKIQPS